MQVHIGTSLLCSSAESLHTHLLQHNKLGGSTMDRYQMTRSVLAEGPCILYIGNASMGPCIRYVTSASTSLDFHCEAALAEGAPHALLLLQHSILSWSTM